MGEEPAEELTILAKKALAALNMLVLQVSCERWQLSTR
jgi:hypothetical protein